MSASPPAPSNDSPPHVEGEAAPRLPHEHDESSDNAARPPDPVIAQAAKDVESGKQPTDKGEVTDPLYEQTLRSPKTQGG